jgi:signal transduction histidine kinase
MAAHDANLKSNEEHYRRRLDEFSFRERDAIFHINQNIAAHGSLDAVMESLFTALQRLVELDRLALFVLEDNRQSAILSWTRCRHGECAILRAGLKVKLPDTILDRAVKQGEVHIESQLSEESVGHFPENHWLNQMVINGARSLILLPLTVGDRSIGALVVASRSAYSFAYHEVQLLQAIKARVSQAVEKAYSIDQLSTANAAYMEVLGFVSHELKNPLGSIVMDGNLLTQGYLGELNEKQHQKIGKMIGKSKYLLSLIREYLDLSRIESGELEAHPRSDVHLLKDVIEPSLDLIQVQIEDRKMQLEQEITGEHLTVMVDPELLVIVMVNLLGNAAKYGSEGGQIKLGIEAEQSGLRVSVWNEGPGFPPEAKDKLFRKFSRVRDPELMKRKGTGVGLYTVWQIIRLHGGGVLADSEYGKWAEFRFEIPQPLTCSI